MDWDRLERLLEEAMALDPEERQIFVADVCGDDDALRTELQSLLAHAEAGKEFLSSPSEEVTSASLTSSLLTPPPPLGPYRLVELLGEGGMGEVWLAEQAEPVQRQVAVKIIKLGMDTRSIVARFHAERQALAVMDHPGIARLIDAGSTPDGRPYFVMDVIRGAPITLYADLQRLPVRDRVQLIIDACEAVAHAHRKDVIHRDLKPSNLLVSEEEDVPRVKVIDFGIAKAMGLATTDTLIRTRTGQVLGTPDYASPEQIGVVSAPIDGRSDVYSLGVVLYELLTGALPWSTGEGLRIVLARRSKGEPPLRPSRQFDGSGTQHTMAEARSTTPTALRQTLQGDLDRIVLRALGNEPDERYATAGELAEDLNRFLRGEPILAPQPRAVRGGRTLIRGWKRAAALAVAAIGGVLLVQGLRPDLPAPASVAPDASAAPLLFSGPITPPVALVVNQDEGSVSVVDLDTQRAVGTILAGEEPQDVVFSPDGRTAYVTERGGHRVLALDLSTGTTSWMESPGREPQGIAITPNGRTLYVANMADDDVRVIHLRPYGYELGPRIPVGDEPFRVRMSPDGSRVYVPNRASDDLSVIDVATHTVIQTIEGLRFPYHVAVAPDGGTAWVTNNGRGTLAVIDLPAGVVVAEIEVGVTPEGVQVSPDGRYVFVANQGSESVTVVDPSTREVVTHIPVGVTPQHIVFTPDGTRAYVPNADSGDVSVIDVATLQVIRTIEVGEAPVGIALRMEPPDATAAEVRDGRAGRADGR